MDTSEILARHHWRLVDRFIESVLDELDLGDLERNIVGLAVRREVETGLVPGPGCNPGGSSRRRWSYVGEGPARVAGTTVFRDAWGGGVFHRDESTTGSVRGGLSDG